MISSKHQYQCKLITVICVFPMVVVSKIWNSDQITIGKRPPTLYKKISSSFSNIILTVTLTNNGISWKQNLIIWLLSVIPETFSDQISWVRKKFSTGKSFQKTRCVTTRNPEKLFGKSFQEYISRVFQNLSIRVKDEPNKLPSSLYWQYRIALFNV